MWLTLQVSTSLLDAIQNEAGIIASASGNGNLVCSVVGRRLR
jgi:hypothetical protein